MTNEIENGILTAAEEVLPNNPAVEVIAAASGIKDV